jgi:hypothetical protein
VSEINFEKIEFKRFGNNGWNFIAGREQELFNKLTSIEKKLETITDRIFQGLKTGADKVFILTKVHETQNCYEVYSSQLDSNFEVEKSICHPLVKGGDSKKYVFNKSSLMILFPYNHDASGKVVLMNEKFLEKNYPLAYSYLNQNKALLNKRDNGKINASSWYGYSRNQALEVIATSKIFTPDISPKSSYSIDSIGETFFTGGVAGGYGIKVKDGVSDLFVLGLLNSNLLDWYLKQISTQMRGGWYSFEAKFIKHFPIKIPHKDQADIQSQVITLVETMIVLNKEKQQTTLPEKLESLQHRIQYTDAKINGLVYQLYGLTEDEIAMVEKS